MTDASVLTGLNQRVWYVEGGVHPLRTPSLLALGKFASDPAQKTGEDKKIAAPDPNSFSKDIQVGTIAGSTDRATLSVGVRSTTQKSILIGWKNKGCRVDIFALSGKCGNPQDFTTGGEKWVYFPDGRISGHGYEGFGAFSRDENKETNEKVDMTSEEYYEFLYMGMEQVGAAYTTRQIMSIDTYKGDDCENCPDPCARVFASMAGTAATPGTQPILLYSADGGTTWAQQTITTLFSNEDVAEGCTIGDDLVYISNIANSIHWTEIDLIFDGTNTWNEVVNGFVKNKGPRSIWSADPRHTWIVGDGGYIYFCANHQTGVVVVDAGVTTTQNLLSVHAYDVNNIIAVGNSNAIVWSKNGGDTWASVTGPAVGVNLGACWMWDKDTWFVGEGAGGTGKLWVTNDSGKTWTQVALPITVNRIDKIVFVSEAEGYVSARSGGMSYILRTFIAGNEWLVLPQGKRSLPLNNSSLTDLAVCSKYSNTMFAAGLASNGTAGIIIRCGA